MALSKLNAALKDDKHAQRCRKCGRLTVCADRVCVLCWPGPEGRKAIEQLTNTNQKGN